MSAEFDKIKQDIRDFNARIQSWNEDELSEDEVDQVDELLEQTIELITGAALDEEESEEDDEMGLIA